MRLLLLFVLAPLAGSAWAQAPDAVLTLPRAFALAEDANPALRSARAKLHAAEGEQSEARGLLNANPELSLQQSRREGPAAGDGITTPSYRESGIGVSQAFEIAGQQGYRREATQHGLAAVRAEVANARVQARAEVEGSFAKVLLLQRRLSAESENLALAREAASAVGKRVNAGEDSRLDGNLASVEAERAQSQRAGVEEQLIEARARLAELLQLPPANLPQVDGELPEHSAGLRFDELLAASAARPELQALLAREAAATSRLKLERAAAIPDITVGLSSAREGPPEARERATVLSVSIPLPFFKRNQAGIGRALTERDQAVIEREVGLRGGEAMVRELWSRLQKLEARVGGLRGTTLPRLDENLSLSRKAYQAGELGILQLVLVNRQVLDARREYLEALGDYTQVRIALERAAGVHALDRSSSTLHASPRTNP